jgi:hypothetical protein
MGAPELTVKGSTTFPLNVLRGDASAITDNATTFTAPEDGIYTFYLKPQQYMNLDAAGTPAIATELALIPPGLSTDPSDLEGQLLYSGASTGAILPAINWTGKLNKGDRLCPFIYSYLNTPAEPMGDYFRGHFVVFQHNQL